jgi:hypothetical protein
MVTRFYPCPLAHFTTQADEELAAHSSDAGSP